MVLMLCWALATTRGLAWKAMPNPACESMGKSFALKAFSENLNPNLYKPVYICLSTVTVGEFYRQLCDMLGIVDALGKNGRFNAIKDVIQNMYMEKKQTLILIVDEAQVQEQYSIN